MQPCLFGLFRSSLEVSEKKIKKEQMDNYYTCGALRAAGKKLMLLNWPQDTGCRPDSGGEGHGVQLVAAEGCQIRGYESNSEDSSGFSTDEVICIPN